MAQRRYRGNGPPSRFWPGATASPLERHGPPRASRAAIAVRPCPRAGHLWRSHVSPSHARRPRQCRRRGGAGRHHAVRLRARAGHRIHPDPHRAVADELRRDRSRSAPRQSGSSPSSRRRPRCCSRSGSATGSSAPRSRTDRFRMSGPPTPQDWSRSRTRCRAKRSCSSSSPTSSTPAGSRPSPPTAPANATSSPRSASRRYVRPPPASQRPGAGQARLRRGVPRDHARSARSSASTTPPLLWSSSRAAARRRSTPMPGDLTALWFSSGSDTPYVGRRHRQPATRARDRGPHEHRRPTSNATWTPLSWEAVIDADPDVIVLIDADWNTAAEQDRPACRATRRRRSSTAVQNDRYIDRAVRGERGGGATGRGRAHPSPKQADGSSTCRETCR